MTHLQHHVCLKPFNTFGIDAVATNFIEIPSIIALQDLIRSSTLVKNALILGGGSNVLFLNPSISQLVIKNSILGIETIKEDQDFVWLKVGAGEVWHNFVLYCLENNLGGVENLSLIPGTVGAAPMQNIGAYGVEVCQVIENVEVVERNTGKLLWISNKDCQFGYRTSIFKQQAKNKYIITAVVFRLTKRNHQLNTSYGAIQTQLNGDEPTIHSISKAVIEIRESKLPNPRELGNGGSFFKNPEIPTSQFEQLKLNFPELVGYPVSDSITKVAAGWLIEQCGWKGKIVGNTGSHRQQALVLVNYGNATGAEIWNLAMQIQTSVKEKFGIEIEPEVNVIS